MRSTLLDLLGHWVANRFAIKFLTTFSVATLEDIKREIEAYYPDVLLETAELKQIWLRAIDILAYGGVFFIPDVALNLPISILDVIIEYASQKIFEI